jgi:tetratricopeptide (TPR) repeat protein
MPENAVKVFISYSHKDEALRDSLATHLSNLQWQGIISSWYDRQLGAGMEWDEKIKTELESADIILLLISPDFIASKYCRDVEIPMALQRHEARQAYVVPIILRPFDWFDAPFSKLQAFPKDAKPVTTWANQDEAFVSVTQGIRTAAKLMLDYRKQEAEQKQLVRAQYLQKVEEVLSDGVISIVERDTLDELRETLGLTSEEAEEIETHVYEPFSRYEESLNKYQQTLNRLVDRGYYPFSEEIEKDLENRQRDLGLKPEDAARVAKPILDQAESAYKKKQIAADADIELRQRQEQERAEYENKLRRYEQEFNRATQAKYPLHQAVIDGLKSFQQQLELTCKDVEQIEHSLISSGDASYKQGKLEEAIFSYKTKLQLDPSNIDALNKLGDIFDEQGKLEEAILEYQKAIKIDPNNAIAYANLGCILTKKGNSNEAIIQCQKAIHINSKCALAYNNMGVALTMQGNWDEAVTHYRKAIKLDPEYALSYSNLGWILAKQGDFNEAVKECQKAISLKPNDADVHLILGSILFKRGDFDEAVKECQKAVSLKPNNTEAHLVLGSVLLGQDKLEEGALEFRKAIEIDPNNINNAGTHVTLGCLLKKKGKLNEAIVEYRRAIQLNPEHAEAHNELGIALYEKNEVDEALAEFSRAIQIDPNYGAVYSNLGDVLKAKGRVAEANQAYQKAEQLGFKRKKIFGIF